MIATILTVLKWILIIFAALIVIGVVLAMIVIAKAAYTFIVEEKKSELGRKEDKDK